MRIFGRRRPQRTRARPSTCFEASWPRNPITPPTTASSPRYAYLSQQTALGDLAAAKAVSLAPEGQRTHLKIKLADVKKEINEKKGARAPPATPPPARHRTRAPPRDRALAAAPEGPARPGAPLPDSAGARRDAPSR